MEQETKRLILEVSLGILLYTLIAMVVTYIFFPKYSVFAGLLTGMATAFAMFVSMAVVLDRDLKTEDIKAIQKQTIVSTVFRYLILIAVFAVIIVWFSDRVSAISTLIGVFGLKVGAYLQPLMHRLLAGRGGEFESDEEFGMDEESGMDEEFETGDELGRDEFGRGEKDGSRYE